MRASTRRREMIVAQLSQGNVSVEELAALHDVSPATIRRDLVWLEQQGNIVRTYGGALASSVVEQPEPIRRTEAVMEKAAIARLACQHIQDHQTLFFDAGTTVGALAQRLVARSTPVTVITNGFTTVNILSGSATVDLFVLGGAFRALSQGTTGAYAEAMARSITANAVFLGADSVVAERGICEASPQQLALKKLLIERSDHTYVLADSSKLGVASSHFWLAPPVGWTLITDEGAPPEQRDAFTRAGVTVEIATLN